jgi:hypothetical protein
MKYIPAIECDRFIGRCFDLGFLVPEAARLAKTFFSEGCPFVVIQFIEPEGKAS